MILMKGEKVLVKNEGEVVFIQSMNLLMIGLMAIILIFLRIEHPRRSIRILKRKEQEKISKNFGRFWPIFEEKMKI